MASAALSKLPALRIVECLESPKSFEELASCAAPPYRSRKEVW